MAIDVNVPATGSPMNSAPLRANFQATQDELDEKQDKLVGSGGSSAGQNIATVFGQNLVGGNLNVPLPDIDGNTTRISLARSNSTPSSTPGPGQLRFGEVHYQHFGSTGMTGEQNAGGALYIGDGTLGTAGHRPWWRIVMSSDSETIIGESNTINPSHSTVAYGHHNSLTISGSSESSSSTTLIGMHNIIEGSGSTAHYDTMVIGTNNRIDGHTGQQSSRNMLIGHGNSSNGAHSLNTNTLLGIDNAIVSGYTGYVQYNTIIGSWNRLSGSTTIESNVIIGRGINMTSLPFGNQYRRNVMMGGSQTSNHESFPQHVMDSVGIGWNIPVPSGISLYHSVAIGSNAVWYNNGGHIGGSAMSTISYGDGTGTAFTNRSDPRVKEDIIEADIQRCLEDIKRLPVVRFKYKDAVNPNKRDKTVTGFLSTDWKKVFPKQVVLDSYRLGDEVIPDCESIDSSQVIPTLVAAVQALSKEIARLHNAYQAA